MRKSIGCLIICGMILFHSNPAKAEESMIENGKVVKINYTLTVRGEIVDSSEGREPLEYTQGNNMIIPGLESQLQGMKVGEKKTVVVGPEDAYGVINQESIIEVPKAQLGENVDPQIGMMLQMQTPSGQALAGKIIEVKDEAVLVDFNHPLAGQELTFDVEVVEIQ